MFSKQHLVTLLLIIAISVLFFGCGPKEPELPATLTILGYGDDSNDEGKTFKRIIDEFKVEYPYINVKYELLVYEAYHQKVVSRLASSDIPDIAYMGADAHWGSAWQAADQQIDNTPFFPSYIDKNLIPDFFGTGVRPYLPLGGSNHCSVVAVNTELLNKIGGKIPETYAELKSLAALCKSKGIKCITTHGKDSWVWGTCVMSAIIPRTTGDAKWIEKAVNKEVKFTDSNFVAALDVLSTWVADDILDPNSVLLDDTAGMATFVNGQSLMYIDGQWTFGSSSLGEMSKTVKLISIPPVPGELASQKGALAGAWQVGYGITKKGASDPNVLEAAKKWLKKFYSYDETVKRLNNGVISSPIIKDFKLSAGMEPIIAEKAKLGANPTCYVIDSYLTGAANNALNAGMMQIISGTKTANQVAIEVQAAFDAQ